MMSIPSTGLGNEERLVVRPRRAWYMLDIGHTHGYALLAAGALKSYRDGRARRITVASIHAYMGRRLAADGATNGATLKSQTMPPQHPAAKKRCRVSAMTAASDTTALADIVCQRVRLGKRIRRND